ncbi:hypothetical protein LENED_003880 [Lentinula edodes]|uniref:Uncharacterized protein n=1 Tax=Lentinula edodes TaxID=5353 RepID=A0A1Q3E508_LENED|nr:hypothetical protein LENED_003880 [Lentinula edodes]
MSFKRPRRKKGRRRRSSYLFYSTVFSIIVPSSTLQLCLRRIFVGRETPRGFDERHQKCSLQRYHTTVIPIQKLNVPSIVPLPLLHSRGGCDEQKDDQLIAAPRKNATEMHMWYRTLESLDQPFIIGFLQDTPNA